MPTSSRREKRILGLFLTAFESGSWKAAKVEWLDEIRDGAVDLLATRGGDNERLAIEHTIVEPFPEDKHTDDFVKNHFARLEQEPDLVVPGRSICVFLSVRSLLTVRRTTIAAATAVQQWIRDCAGQWPVGQSHHTIPIPGRRRRSLDATVKVALDTSGLGRLRIGRQEPKHNFDLLVRKVLQRKLPKLVNTEATRRILMLERQHINLDPNRIMSAIGECGPQFPELNAIHQVWIVESMFDCEHHGSCLRFERYGGAVLRVVQSYDFRADKLWARMENEHEELIF